jgi:Icc-related predicted phosphoesterase
MGTEQYSEWEMSWKIIRMTPKLLWNKYRHGRALDVLITHSPARDINDREDPPHRGFKIMRMFLHWFKPAYQLHGHVHLYDRSEPFTTEYEETTVINVYPYQVLDLDPPAHEVPPDSPLNAS